MDTNNLETILQTGVKFYASKSKAEALALATQQENPEPGAICFVSDDSGNYIILNGRIFGDGTSGTGGGGAVSSVNSKTGAVVLELGDLQVTTGKTLANYFNDGSFLTPEIKIQNTLGLDVITINENGILIGDSYVVTRATALSLIDSNNTVIRSEIAAAELSAKDYADALSVSVYKVKGSVESFSALQAVADKQVGDVYNLLSTNVNYVWTGTEWDPLGGSIDLSNVYTKLEVNTLVSNAITESKNYTDLQNTNFDLRITANLTSISNLSNSLNSHTTQINQNTTNITNIATTLTWQ